MGLRPDQSRAAPQERHVPDGEERDAGRALDEKDDQLQDTHVVHASKFFPPLEETYQQCLGMPYAITVFWK